MSSYDSRIHEVNLCLCLSVSLSLSLSLFSLLIPPLYGLIYVLIGGVVRLIFLIFTTMQKRAIYTELMSFWVEQGIGNTRILEEMS